MTDYRKNALCSECQARHERRLDVRGIGRLTYAPAALLATYLVAGGWAVITCWLIMYVAGMDWLDRVARLYQREWRVEEEDHG